MTSLICPGTVSLSGTWSLYDVFFHAVAIQLMTPPVRVPTALERLDLGRQRPSQNAPTPRAWHARTLWAVLKGGGLDSADTTSWRARYGARSESSGGWYQDGRAAQAIRFQPSTETRSGPTSQSSLETMSVV